MKKPFLILAFLYTICIIIYAASQPLDSWINRTWLWGVTVSAGIPVPTGFFCIMAVPAFVLLVLSMCFDRD